MKKQHIIAVAILFTAKLATAQTEKGTQNIGLNFTAEHSTSNGTIEDNTTFLPQTSDYSNIGLGINYSYFIADKLDVAADLSYSHDYNGGTSDYAIATQIDHNYAADIFIRKYFMCSEKFGFRAGPYADYSYGNTSYESGPNDPVNEVGHSSEHNIGGGLRLEMVYYPLKHLGLSAMLLDANYSHSMDHNIDSGKDNSNNYNLNLLGNVTAVSLFYVFGK
jgi:hypothetical protein